MDEESVNEHCVSYMDSDNEDLNKDSIDCKNIKLKVYEETMNNLIAENKSLRQQIQRLTEESREQEDRFMQAINEAADEHKKLDEKNQSKHRSQLQSYYECFVQLEKENDNLKLHVQELCEKLKNNQENKTNFDDLNENKNENDDDDDSLKVITKKAKYDRTSVTTTNNVNVNSPLKSINQNIIYTQKDEEIKELKYEIEKLKSENETFKSMKTYMQERNEKRASIMQQQQQHQQQSNNNNKSCDNHLELTETINHLEMEKSLLEKKLSSLEASLTRWIFRACDYKTDLQKVQQERNELQTENQQLNKEMFDLNDKYDKTEKLCKEYELKYENEKITQAKFKFQYISMENDMAKYMEQIQKQKEEIDRLTSELKANEERRGNDKLNIEKAYKQKYDASMEQIKALEEALKKKEAQINQLEKEKEGVQQTNVEMKLKEINAENTIYELKEENNEVKTKMNKLRVEYELSETKYKQIKHDYDQFKSENNYYSKKFEQITNENQTFKKKYDSLVLEKNALKCKYEEIQDELTKLKAKPANIAPPPIQPIFIEAPAASHAKKPHHSHTKSTCIQTDDFDYDSIIKPIRFEYEQRINDHQFKEKLYKNEIEQYKSKLAKIEERLKEANDALDQEYKLNENMRDRNDYLYDKCEKLKFELDTHEAEMLKLKSAYEHDKQISDTTISQQKKAIDLVTQTAPELVKKLKLYKK